MQYLLMIYRSEAEYGKIDAATRQEMTAEYGAFTQSIIQSGNFKAGDGLQPTTTATTVRVRDGKTLTTDGPFAETRWMKLLRDASRHSKVSHRRCRDMRRNGKDAQSSVG